MLLSRWLLVIRDWRCSEEDLLGGELSASVGTVWVQSEEAVVIPAQARSASAVIELLSNLDCLLMFPSCLRWFQVSFLSSLE